MVRSHGQTHLFLWLDIDDFLRCSKRHPETASFEDFIEAKEFNIGYRNNLVFIVDKEAKYSASSNFYLRTTARFAIFLASFRNRKNALSWIYFMIIWRQGYRRKKERKISRELS